MGSERITEQTEKRQGEGQPLAKKRVTRKNASPDKKTEPYGGERGRRSGSLINTRREDVE